MFADNQVADTRCSPAEWPDQLHDSDGVSLQEIALLFDRADYAWISAAGGPDLERRFRRQRYEALCSVLAGLRAASQARLESWRAVAAADRDYSGADPSLEMLRLKACISVVRAMAWWRIAHGWPAPDHRPVLAWCQRSVLQPVISA